MHKNVLETALGKQPADLLLTNCRIADVFTGTFFEGNIAIKDGIIAGIGDYSEAETILDLQGAYVTPGLINAHCHVESSMTTPAYYCAEELRFGVTTLITDPHEIANVAGLEGISYMLQAGQSMPVNYFIQLPSCVPATPFEHAGYTLTADDLSRAAKLNGVSGLGEVMNVPGVLMQDTDLEKKITLFSDSRYVIDGHSPGVTGKQLQAYVGCGIQTDHESTSWSEAKEKLRSGMAILVREGSASKNLEAIISGALADNIDFTRMAFCTDDKHLADIKAEGTIRHCMRKAVQLGLSPIKAIQMATYNAAKIYGLKHLGALAPGYQADITVFDDLQDFNVQLVLHKGQPISEQLQQIKPFTCPASLLNTVKPAPFSAANFASEKFLAGKQYPVIEMLPKEILTECSYIDGSEVQELLQDDQLCLIAVIERHHQTGHIGLGLLRGYGLKNGAAATTVAHDSHNLIVIGTDPASMETAARELLRTQGGYTLVQNGKVIRTIPLTIGGLMSSEPSSKLIEELEIIKELAHQQGVKQDIDPFISLSFMALPVIPKVRITDMGVFDTVKFEFIK